MNIMSIIHPQLVDVVVTMYERRYKFNMLLFSGYIYILMENSFVHNFPFQLCGRLGMTEDNFMEMISTIRDDKRSIIKTKEIPICLANQQKE